jgi:hypothetical protein
MAAPMKLLVVSGVTGAGRNFLVNGAIVRGGSVRREALMVTNISPFGLSDVGENYARGEIRSNFVQTFDLNQIDAAAKRNTAVAMVAAEHSLALDIIRKAGEAVPNVKVSSVFVSPVSREEVQKGGIAWTMIAIWATVARMGGMEFSERLLADYAGMTGRAVEELRSAPRFDAVVINRTGELGDGWAEPGQAPDHTAWNFAQRAKMAFNSFICFGLQGAIRDTRQHSLTSSEDIENWSGLTI